MAGNSAALLAAARVIASALRKAAGARTDETARAVNIQDEGDHADINAGSPGGRWGWEPIQAWMFATGAKHPLFGDRGHWYAQPYYPFLDIAVADSADEAAQVYADIEIQRLLDEYLS